MVRLVPLRIDFLLKPVLVTYLWHDVPQMRMWKSNKVLEESRDMGHVLTSCKVLTVVHPTRDTT